MAQLSFAPFAGESKNGTLNQALIDLGQPLQAIAVVTQLGMNAISWTCQLMLVLIQVLNPAQFTT